MWRSVHVCMRKVIFDINIRINPSISPPSYKKILQKIAMYCMCACICWIRICFECKYLCVLAWQHLHIIGVKAYNTKIKWGTKECFILLFLSGLSLFLELFELGFPFHVKGIALRVSCLRWQVPRGFIQSLSLVKRSSAKCRMKQKHERWTLKNCVRNHFK